MSVKEIELMLRHLPLSIYNFFDSLEKKERKGNSRPGSEWRIFKVLFTYCCFESSSIHYLCRFSYIYNVLSCLSGVWQLVSIFAGLIMVHIGKHDEQFIKRRYIFPFLEIYRLF